MAQRNLAVEAIILHTRESPGGGRFVSCLSREQGLLDCFLFGGGRSKLRSLVLPWHTGRLYLYADAKNSLKKITDFDPEFLYGTVRRQYDSIMLATWASELMIATHGLGGTGFTVMQELLETIESILEKKHEAGFLETEQPISISEINQSVRLPILMRALQVVFALKVLHHSGNFYTTYACEHCTGTSAENSVLYYSPYTGGFVCEACSDEQSLSVPHKDVNWLFNALEEPMRDCINEPDTVLRLEASVHDMLARVLAKPLRTQAFCR